MGGRGSGGGNRVSDAEKKRRGTFRPDKSEEALAAKAAETVVVGPWLETIPPAVFPLGVIGQTKYFEFTRALHSQNKLTMVTQVQAEMAARQFEKIHALTEAGKYPTASDVQQLARALDALKIAEDAPKLTNPSESTSKFAACGFSTRRDAKVQIRKSSPSRS